MTPDEQIRRLEREAEAGGISDSIRLVRERARHPHVETDLVFAKCEACFHGPIHMFPTAAMTAYSWDGKGENPNRAQSLCPTCSQEYVEYWEEQWAEYYASQGVAYETSREKRGREFRLSKR